MRLRRRHPSAADPACRHPHTGVRPFRATAVALLATTLAAALTGACSPADPALRTAGAASPGPRTAARTAQQWTASWGATMQQATDYTDHTDDPKGADGAANWSREGFQDESLRQVIRLSVGGSALRLRFSNAYGTRPLHLAGATVARSDGQAKARPGTARALTFDHARSRTVPAGGTAVTDPVSLPTANLEKLTVTLRFTTPTGPATMHRFTTATSYRAPGDWLDSTADAAFDRRTSHAWYYLTGADVLAAGPDSAASVLVFGDSLMDGVGTSPGTDDRFSDKLAERLIAAGRPTGIANAGLAGDRLLHDSPCFGEKGTARFVRELRGHAGLRAVFVHLGANDLSRLPDGDSCGENSRPVTARQLIDGHRALIREAHARGIKAIGVTLPPLAGAVFPFTDPAGIEARGELNHWIRTSHAYDAVLDAARVLTDPQHPDRTRPGYVSQDGLHPSDAGYLAMASAVDLTTL
ncbi:MULTISPECIES: SGNH/GDSL hydrolase family protein [unclassified Streptomyces]|uniref:SGNH/GDSL hydrolase family protein n=1 Tax=unclassified Streptomyces TaxID=2593676 RepID=UPI00036792A2|nr:MULTISPECIES: SGNH/GDSL hydrolase family protein [unclassified Streptomyces]MYT28852.1 SGNH/GDSL hydrolase family protein [Streptomyces sp. SID8354]